MTMCITRNAFFQETFTVKSDVYESGNDQWQENPFIILNFGNSLMMDRTEETVIWQSLQKVPLEIKPMSDN